ncbi:MAG TPA: FAD-dependent oxidoreductase [Bryobacteraceae bacterium]|nr:FAD-dependent oxidoreductase [Bryobacteraceae bacterium]
MKRRDFFSLLGLEGYSLVYLAREAQGQPPSSPPDAARQEIEREFDRIAPPERLRHMAANEPHMALVDLEADILVAGGGMAGVCAAVAAARHGAKVILIQDRSCLGGNSSGEVKMHIVGASCHRGRLGWRESGLLEEFRLDDAVNNPQRCWEMWELLLYDKVMSEKNITLLLDTSLCAASTKDGRIEQVLARSDKTEFLYRIAAPIFCDCTGDSRLALEAGCEMRTGREARAEFNEPLAPPESDNETLGSSILFTSRLHHEPMPFTPPKWARKITPEQLRHRKIDSWEYGYWWIEWGGNIDTIHDNQRIRFELLSIVMGIWDYIKNSGQFPDSHYWALDWIGMMPGKRGSRRLLGDHILTQQDLMSGDFEDAVAIGGWPMDDHPPGGFDRPDLPPNTTLKPPEVYNIPLRSLYSRNVSNLLMAGRNISATHVAFTSTRVMGTCSTIGQAVGTAAFLCAQHKVTPRLLYQNKDLLADLQSTLLRDDQTIKNRRNEDPKDLARKAHVTASAEQDGMPARLVIDGYTRDIPGGAKHHWAARLESGGAWIELAWEQPRAIREIQITFDSGFQRELTLSAQDSVNAGVIRAAQPETVKDYQILYRKSANGDLLQAAEVKGNHQRLNRHRVDITEAQALRIRVNATNGDAFARIFEIRCYG